MEQRFHLSFHGSRTLHDERVRIIILEEIERHKPTAIVTHAEPEGVCELARTIAKERAIPLKVHFLNFRYLRGAFEHRSKDVLRDSDFSVFIHDGRSKGTANEIALAGRMGIGHACHTLAVTEYKSSVGFEIETPWEIESGEIDRLSLRDIR